MRRCFVYRADGLSNGRDLYLVIPDRSDAPGLEPSFLIEDGRPMFLPSPEELLEVVDDQDRGLAAVIDAAPSPLWIADPALEEAGALLGLARADPPRAVVCTATATVLIRAWGVQATTIADVEVFMRLLEACRAAAATAPDPDRLPLEIELAGSTHHRHRSPHSTLLRAPLPTGEPGFLIALHAGDVEAIEALVAEGRYHELHAFDLIHVAFKQQPVFAARLFGVLHGFAAVPMVTRIDGGAAVLLSAEDLLTIVSALELYARG